MSGVWFSNRGQIIQIVIALIGAVFTAISCLLALSIQAPELFNTGVNGLKVAAPLIAVPALIVGLYNLFFNYVLAPILDRMSRQMFEKEFPELRRTENETPPAVTQPEVIYVAKAAPEGFIPREVRSDDVKINIGGYWEEKIGLDRLRISVKDAEELNGKRLVKISFDHGGGVFHSGSEVGVFRVNEFSMPESRTGFQSEEKCVYRFSWSEDHIHFFAARMDGVDLHAKQVAVNFVVARLLNVPKDQ